VSQGQANSIPGAIIGVRGLHNRFGKQVVHEHLDLDITRGEILGIVGGSGSGKSVLMRSILGLHQPQAGRVQWFGHDRDQLDIVARRSMERRLGVMFQDGALFSSLSVLENVMVPLREHTKLNLDFCRELAQLKLALVGLPIDAGQKSPEQLSGGMRKRAGIARALALDPEVLFLDEPTSGLDPIGAGAFDALIRTLNESLGLTVIVITHDLDSLYAICDRVAVLADRRVLICDRPEVVAVYDHPWIRECFHGARGRAASEAAARALALSQASTPSEASPLHGN
jgi:phospholipid/cholesterol/gamma-HCH transport system ATP-binding protein